MAQRILFATMPFDGHFSPLTGIARHLRDQGHDVRWYAGPSYAKKLADLGIRLGPEVFQPEAFARKAVGSR